MIYELRTYTLTFGALPRYFALYEATGLAIQQRILGDPLGYFSSEVGALNQVLHLWGYASFEDRLARRARLWADPAWIAFGQEIAPMVTAQENRILLAAPFWPVPCAP